MPILPTVLPDEFALGYWGRIHILNLFATPNQTIEALIDHFAVSASRIQRIEALALTAGISTQSFVQNHTLIPVQSAITFEFGGVQHGNPKFSALIKQSWKLLQKPGAHFCPQCAADQQARWGLSYWCRSHQLRGVDWCIQHSEPLLRCNESSFTSATPNVDLAINAAPKLETEKSYWPILVRYSKIMHSLLARTVRARMRDVTSHLRSVAIGKSINTGTHTEGQYLSDLAAALLPDWWLQELFPSIIAKRPNTPFSPLDNTVLYRHAQPHAFALAMALIYESSDEALASLPQ